MIFDDVGRSRVSASCRRLSSGNRTHREFSAFGRFVYTVRAHFLLVWVLSRTRGEGGGRGGGAEGPVNPSRAIARSVLLFLSPAIIAARLNSKHENRRQAIPDRSCRGGPIRRMRGSFSMRARKRSALRVTHQVKRNRAFEGSGKRREREILAWEGRLKFYVTYC